jgi:hypothetical protein
MPRVLAFIVLSLLLLSMQHQGRVHPIEHLAGYADTRQDIAFSAPHVVADCVECALLAGSLNGLPGSFVSSGSAKATDVPVFLSYRSPADDVPAWFQSRAPPVLV